MAQLDSYLKRKYSEYDVSYLEDFYDMYSFVRNEDFCKILAAFAGNTSRWKYKGDR